MISYVIRWDRVGEERGEGQGEKSKRRRARGEGQGEPNRMKARVGKFLIRHWNPGSFPVAEVVTIKALDLVSLQS